MISDSLLQEVASLAELQGPGEAVLAQLRTRHPDVHFTYCMDDDISVNAKATLSRPRFNLYLVDSREHCSCLTNDPASASGVVLAEVIDDD